MPSAAILAGGHATRFGGLDKGAVVVHGRSILDRQLTALSAITDDILYVGAKPPPEYRGRLRYIADTRPGLGPLAGLEAALAAARDDTLLLLACDMPFVTPAFLGFLVGLADDSRRSGVMTEPWESHEIDAVVPRTDRGRHPLAAVYRRTCNMRVRARLDAGQLAMRGLLEELRVRDVGREAITAFGDPDWLLANVNTPADLDLVQSFAGHTQ